MAMMITIVNIAITIIIVIYNLLSWLMIWGAQNDQQFCDVMSIVGAYGCHGLNFGSIRRSPEFNSRPMQDGN